jgi:tRNA splicing ligase
LSNKIYDCNLSGCSHHSGIPLQDVYKKVFGLYKTDLEFKFGAGAQFIVSKQQILKRSKEFYENIVHLLSYSINPIEGFVIERFHSLIFS